MAMPAKEIADLIRAALPDAVVTMTDLAGDNDHWKAHVISSAFVGKSRVAQHKMVYDALGERMGGELHALQLTTAVPN
ncbi:BolA family transcriptional regulator [Novosphingobium sp. PC22D]|uniref:BolA/IbaG family iron-sulfur metabolism protein n=1 Tax=Novosphingobium sp. PC22D TaxID=1962403 RepID=UPI000BEF5489|nr:BolA family transcriptional regulator [Novosphingobium sp. PC22D]PEQ14369.1 BolA family transcriptional regulator [Novosphingobium sp. PC22D]